MPRISIEELNRRLAHRNRNRDGNGMGGRNYARHDRAIGAATVAAWAQTERDRLAALDPVESLMEQVGEVFADFRSWAANQLPLALAIEIGRDDQIPF